MTRTKVEESGSMNIAFVYGDRIVTPSLTGSILEGITRDSSSRSPATSVTPPRKVSSRWTSGAPTPRPAP